MINHWQDIVAEQLSLLGQSGLFDKLSSIKICCLGSEESREELEKLLLTEEGKAEIVYHSTNIKEYEFPTLKVLWDDANDSKPFYGVYFHTKGASFPNHSGGKYWRDYMNHYNITKWKDCEKNLRKGYDLCGVKYIPESVRPYKKHYSGNFFWFKSSYVKTLKDPLQMDLSDRYNAEFWIGTGDCVPASLCQLFVDYNTKGEFHKCKGKNYVHTLAYNLVSETEKAVKLLYELNDNLIHYIIDLGYPIEKPGVIPKDIEQAKKNNSERLKKLADEYGSKYVQLPNIGVSQNWEAVFRMLDMKDEDILIGADPDERPLDSGWVDAMGEVLRNSDVGLASLMMTDHISMLHNANVTTINGVKCITNGQRLNWALIGMSGKFLKGMNGVPYPKNAERYGWIESMIRPYFDKLKMRFAVLPEYRVRHTDYQLGDKGTCNLLREWKNLIIFKIAKYGQISFEQFLIMKQNKKL